ncbi:MAG: hypothetical protein ACI38Q_06180 [Candidatus Bruticola sp.]
MSLTTSPRFEEKDLQYYLGALRNSRPFAEYYQSANDEIPKFRGAILISQTYIGSPDNLGEELLSGIIMGLNSQPELPKYLIFMHEAVRFCTEGSKVLPVLQLLQKRGCSLRICEHSAQALDLSDKIKVGHQVSTRLILEICLKSEKVIRF